MKNVPETGSVMIGGAVVPFTVRRSPRRRRSIAFAVEEMNGLSVAAPVRISLSSIQKIVERNAHRIVPKLMRFQAGIAKNEPRPFTQGAIIHYYGHACRLDIIHDLQKPQGCTLGLRRVTVNLHNPHLSAEDLRDEVRTEITLWLKKRAKSKLKQRMDMWSRRLGIPYRQFLLSSPSRQWGSCTARNVIRLNWRLITMPPALMDYVVVHELCHVVEKNHAPRFWHLVAMAIPDYALRRKRLRQFPAH